MYALQNAIHLMVKRPGNSCTIYERYQGLLICYIVLVLSWELYQAQVHFPHGRTSSDEQENHVKLAKQIRIYRMGCN